MTLTLISSACGLRERDAASGDDRSKGDDDAADPLTG